MAVTVTTTIFTSTEYTQVELAEFDATSTEKIWCIGFYNGNINNISDSSTSYRSFSVFEVDIDKTVTFATSIRFIVFLDQNKEYLGFCNQTTSAGTYTLADLVTTGTSVGTKYLAISTGVSGNYTITQDLINYDITYIVDGITYSSQTAIEGRLLTKPTDPSKNYYIFNGWYLSDGTAWDFDTDIVSSDLTLTAQWVADPNYVFVYFNSNGGTTVETQYIKIGGYIAQPDCARNGYILAYWSEDGSTIWNFNTTPVTESITLNAIWTTNPEYYALINWQNEVTPINEANMNHMDEGIYNATVMARGGYSLYEELDGSTLTDFVKTHGGENAGLAEEEVNTLITNSLTNYPTTTEMQTYVTENSTTTDAVKALLEELDVPTQAVLTSRWRGKKVGWIGDSITQGYTWCEYVNTAFDFEASSLGVGGTTVTYEGASSMSEMTRLTGEYSNVTDPNTGEVTITGKVMPTDLDVLFFQGATNDWARNHPIGTVGQKWGKATEYTAVDYSSGTYSTTITTDSTKSYKLSSFDPNTQEFTDITYSYTTTDSSEATTTGTTSDYLDGTSYTIIEATYTTTITETSELLDSTQFVVGYYLSGGSLSSHSSYTTSGYFRVAPGTTWTSTTSLRFTNYFDSTGTYVSSENNVNTSTVPDGCYFMRVTFASTLTSGPTITRNELGEVVELITADSEYSIIGTPTSGTTHQPNLYDACYQFYQNLLNYQTKTNFQVIALGTGYGKMPDRAAFTDKAGVINNQGLSTVQYGDVLVETAGEFGWLGINIGREMGVNHGNIELYIPDQLHFTTKAVQKMAARVIINYLLAHEPRDSDL